MHIDSRMDRRLFFKRILAGSSVLLAGMATSCKPKNPFSHIKGSILGANSAVGHIMRNIDALPPPGRRINTDILIVGGGISGLSAKRWLQQQGHKCVMLIEMDDHFGGNAHHGKNGVSAYPWGAHYIPVPDIRNTELLNFLKEINVITGYGGDGLPVYNDYYICHDPEERLFINGLWQDGLVPEAGVPEADKQQFVRFANIVKEYKVAVGADGKDAFAIPLDNSSTDPLYRKLDGVSFRKYLQDQGFTSKYLLWYLEYGCKDDYGCNLDNTSAWAGFHYYASRKGKGVNANTATVLTWPQGNGFLMEHLKKQVGDEKLFSNQLAYKLTENETGVEVLVYDVLKKESYCIATKKVIMASPQFANKHLLQSMGMAAKTKAWNDFHYAPWVVANITVNNLPQQRGLPLCWDNVIYGTASVGYVDANHQELKNSDKRVVTFYLPLVNEAPEVARRKAQAMDYNKWLGVIIKELEYAHGGITACILSVDIWVWGHGMIAPRPGFIWGDSRRMAAAPINNKIFFAHSDLSGISIFEEAFYQGIKAAKQVIAS